MPANVDTLRAIARACLLTALLSPSAARAESFAPPAAHAAYVDPVNGRDVQAEGSPQSPYATLEKGMQAAWQQIQINIKAAEETLLLFDAAVQWAVDADSLPVSTGTAAMVVDRDDLLGPSAVGIVTYLPNQGASEFTFLSRETDFVISLPTSASRAEPRRFILTMAPSGPTRRVRGMESTKYRSASLCSCGRSLS